MTSTPMGKEWPLFFRPLGRLVAQTNLSDPSASQPRESQHSAPFLPHRKCVNANFAPLTALAAYIVQRTALVSPLLDA